MRYTILIFLAFVSLTLSAQTSGWRKNYQYTQAYGHKSDSLLILPKVLVDPALIEDGAIRYNLLTGKSNTSHTHTTSSITDLSSVLGAYATDSELSSGLSGKANSSDVYTQSQVNSMVNSKADQSSLNSTNSNVSSLSSRMSIAESNINNKVSKGWSLIQSLTVGNLYNNGSMTMLKMNGSLSVNSSGWTTLGTISTTYAPPYSQTAIDGAGCFILVTSAGAVQTYYKGIFGDTKSKTSGNPPQVIWVCNGDM